MACKGSDKKTGGDSEKPQAAHGDGFHLMLPAGFRPATADDHAPIKPGGFAALSDRLKTVIRIQPHPEYKVHDVYNDAACSQFSDTLTRGGAKLVKASAGKQGDAATCAIEIEQAGQLTLTTFLKGPTTVLLVYCVFPADAAAARAACGDALQSIAFDPPNGG